MRRSALETNAREASQSRFADVEKRIAPHFGCFFHKDADCADCLRLFSLQEKKYTIGTNTEEISASPVAAAAKSEAA